MINISKFATSRNNNVNQIRNLVMTKLQTEIIEKSCPEDITFLYEKKPQSSSRVANFRRNNLIYIAYIIQYRKLIGQGWTMIRSRNFRLGFQKLQRTAYCRQSQKTQIMKNWCLEIPRFTKQRAYFKSRLRQNLNMSTNQRLEF